MQTRVSAARYAEHCKRGYVCAVLHPEAQAAIGEDTFQSTKSAAASNRALVEASIRGADSGSTVRIAQDMLRAQQLAVLNPLVEQLQRMSDEYTHEVGFNVPLTAAGLSTHEAAKRGL